MRWPLKKTVVGMCIAVPLLAGLWLLTDEGGSASQESLEKQGAKTPFCVGLKCNDDSDCGRKCRCELPAGKAIGKCVLKNPAGPSTPPKGE